eukprot:3908550-Amphidinium_carterae.1
MAEGNKGETPAWNVRGPGQQRFSKGRSSGAVPATRAMLLDPELAKSYEGLRAMGKDAKAAKEAFKMKWAATNVKGVSMKRKSTSTEQVQAMGRDGRYATMHYRGKLVLIASVPIARVRQVGANGAKFALSGCIGTLLKLVLM